MATQIDKETDHSCGSRAYHGSKLNTCLLSGDSSVHLWTHTTRLLYKSEVPHVHCMNKR